MPKPRLAILYDESEKFSPSNPHAIKLFEDAAKKKGFDVNVGNFIQLMKLEYDAVLIRQTTATYNATCLVALDCDEKKIPCIDDIYSIRKCCDKSWQYCTFVEKNILIPHTTLLNMINFIDVSKIISYPCVIKIPESCFSLGVYKVDNKNEFIALCSDLFNDHILLIAQEFLESEFDWRIAILDRKPLFAVKYYIPEGDFRITKHKENGKYIEGRHECISLSDVPDYVLETAVNAVCSVGNSLYGIDIKDINQKAYVIEINDNISIDHGVEDELLGSKIYDKIIDWFLERIHP